MIAQKVLSTSYVIEAEGKAAETLFPFAKGLNRISFISGSYDTDISAISRLNEAMSSMCKMVDTSDTNESIEFNPDFFPTYSNSLDEEQKEAQSFNDQMISNARFEAGADTPPEKIEIGFMPVFDELGDFVEMKWTVESEELLIEARLIANPDEWLKEKMTESITRILSTSQEELITRVH